MVNPIVCFEGDLKSSVTYPQVLIHLFKRAWKNYKKEFICELRVNKNFKKMRDDPLLFLKFFLC